MNPVLLGILCGFAFGVADVPMVVFGNHPERMMEMMLQAFTSRFAVGLLAVNVSLPMHPVVGGALVGLLIILPDAFGLNAYTGILGSGLLFGGLGGLAAKLWATHA